MAELARPPPELILEGNLAQKWKKWYQRFQLYMEASGLNSKPDKQKVAIFLNTAGEQALDVYNTLTFSEEEHKYNLDIVLSKFQLYCQPKKNLTYERFKFFSRSQGDDETIDAYVTTLKNLAKSCEFEEQQDSLIKDRLIIGLKDKHLQERLLEDDIKLEQAIDFCRSREANKHHVQEMMSNASINVLKQKSQRKIKDDREAKEQRKIKDDREAKQQRKICQRCGRKHNNKECPAWGKKCNKCKKFNHFASQCRTAHAIQEDSSSELEDEDFILEIKTAKVNKLQALGWIEKLKVQDKKITFKLDTGADVNIITRRQFDGIKRKPAIRPTSRILTSYSGHEIKLQGTCILHCITEKNIAKNLEFCIVQGDFQPVLGLTAIEQLGLAERVHAATEKIAAKGNVEAEQIIAEFDDVFKGQGELKFKYNIELSEAARPIQQPSRKIPIALQKRVKEELDKMVQNKTIEKVEEPTEWTHPIVLVHKPDGGLRICIDPRTLNKYIKREVFQIPTFEDIAVQLSGSSVYTVLDASTAYWQIPLTEESSKLCTISTPYGRYRFKRLPYGLSSAAEVFQRAIHKIIEGMEGVSAYMDDCIVFGKDMAEHNDRLKKVLERFRKFNLKINRQKLKLAKDEVVFMGHKIGPQGISPSDKHIQAIMKIPSPKTKKELQSFLGSTNYLSKFIRNYSERTKVLRNILSEKNQWNWEDTEQKCFEELKKAISEAPVLAHFDPKKRITLATDASQYGLGAILMQEGKPIAYASTALTECQQKYSQIEKELLAIVNGCQKFKYYLYGNEFDIQTDHKPLLGLIHKPFDDLSPRLQRLCIKLLAYQGKLKYVPGKEMHVADMLSRCPDKEDTINTDYLEGKANVVQTVICASEERVEQVVKHTEKDVTLNKIRKRCEEGWPKYKSQMDSDEKPYWEIKSEIHVSDGIVFRGKAIVVPKGMQKEILDKLHVVHQGINSCKRRAKDCVYWPSMTKELDELVRSCEICQKYERSNSKEPLIQHEVSLLPWDKMGADFLKFQDKVYLLVVDYHSKFIEIRQTNSTKAEKVMKALEGIFRTHGVPTKIMSDNGPPFDSDDFRKFGKRFDCDLVTSSPHYPRSNGLVERSIQTIKKLMYKTAESGRDPELAVMEYNATPKENLPSPGEMLMGRKLRTSVIHTKAVVKPKFDTSETIRIMVQNQKKQKRYADRHTHPLESLHVGDFVTMQEKKQWVPAIVKKQTRNPRSYIVETQNGRLYRRNRVHLRKRVLMEDFPREREEKNDRQPIAEQAEDSQLRTRSGRY